MAHYEINEELDGIQLYFDGVFPDTKLRNHMKSLKMRWNPNKKCSKQNNGILKELILLKIIVMKILKMIMRLLPLTK